MAKQQVRMWKIRYQSTNGQYKEAYVTCTWSQIPNLIQKQNPDAETLLTATLIK